jgi:hypothetical protein
MILYSTSIKTLGPVGAALLTRMAESGRPIFTSADAQKLLRTSPHAAAERLRLLAKRGYLSVSVDLPCHGDEVKDKERPGLAGWRDRLEKGEAVAAARRRGGRSRRRGSGARRAS